MDCKQRLESIFRERGTEYTTHHHPVAYTAQETAAKDNVPGRIFAKPVILFADEEMVLAVIAAPDRVDFGLLAEASRASNVRLATESDFADRFQDCEVGAMPPMGSLYGLRTYVDTELAHRHKIVFAAGTHTDTISLAYADYAAVEDPIVAELRATPVGSL